ncbi:MAG: hypothetical protein V4850_35480 [Myxococcota bacterium]
MRTRLGLALLVLPLAACGVTVRPTCETVSETELDDAEISGLGFSVDQLLGVVAGDHAAAGTYEDGTSAEVAVGITRGAGPARLVRTESASVRTPNGTLFGEQILNIHVTCHDVVTVPVQLRVETIDGVVTFDEAADAVAADEGGLGDVTVAARVPADEAEGLLLPDRENPVSAFAEARFLDSGTATARQTGQVGWEGEHENGVWAQYLLEWDSPMMP